MLQQPWSSVLSMFLEFGYEHDNRYHNHNRNDMYNRRLL
jgi:hypothetical protein